jgi:hypothetical protein
MAESALYINKPGGVVIHEVSGESVTYPYGKQVDLSQIREEQLQYLPSVTSTTRPPDAPLQDEIDSITASMERAGVERDTGSAVPDNYDSLDEDQAVRLVQSMPKSKQAEIVAYEMANKARVRVQDAADNDAKEQADVMMAIKQFKGEAPEEAKEEKPEAKKTTTAKAGSTPKPTAKTTK